MNRVIFDISMSLDGYVTAAGRTPQNPMGEGGLRLVQWAFGEDERDRAVLTEGVAGLGAVIAGRATYDTSLPWWGPNGPSGDARAPVFVVTHSEPHDAPKGGVYTFVTDGVETALKRAMSAAGSRYVTVMGGAQTGRQFLRAGLLDELSIHLVPVILGGGTRLFDEADEQVELEPVSAVSTPNAVHLRYRVAH